MPNPYKHQSGRIQLRKGNGQFFTPTLSDLGYDVADGAQVCSNCGYGKEEEWRPILKTGYCPKCRSQEKEALILPASEHLIWLENECEKLEKTPFITRKDLDNISKWKSEISKEKSRLKREYFNQFLVSKNSTD